MENMKLQRKRESHENVKFLRELFGINDKEVVSDPWEKMKEVFSPFFSDIEDLEEFLSSYRESGD